MADIEQAAPTPVTLHRAVTLVRGASHFARVHDAAFDIVNRLAAEGVIVLERDEKDPA